MSGTTRGRQLRVIGAGLPRTGTTSLGKALSHLLQGPVFDGGHLSFFGTSADQRRLLDLASHLPARTPADTSYILYQLSHLTAGHVASVDQPGCFMLEEMMKLYPDAVVIVTTRDKQGWWESYTTLWECIQALYPWSFASPQLYRFCDFSVKFWIGVPSQVGLSKGPVQHWPMDHHRGLYEAHGEYIKRVVPEEKLFYMDVKEGWGPLCEILDVPVPRDVEFPHEFNRESLTSAKERLLVKLKARLTMGVMAVVMLLWGSWLWFLRD